MIEKLISDQYGLEVHRLSVMPAGVGGTTYLVETASEKYILKSIHNDDYIQNEPEVAAYLKQNDIPVAGYIKSKGNEYFCKQHGNTCCLREYVEGETLDYNGAPDWFMVESAQILGKMHAVLSGFRPLPIGMGQGFVDYMASGGVEQSYAKTLATAQELGDHDIADDVAYRLTLVEELKRIHFDLSKLSCKNTHGDYKIGNIICKDNRIAAVIDLSGACIHPIVWEIIRSFTYADPSCKNGEINVEKFLEYVKKYLAYSPLNEYDLRMMPFYLYHQLLSCDYYSQYYHAIERNRNDFLHQATFATKLIRWFERNSFDLSDSLFALA